MENIYKEAIGLGILIGLMIGIPVSYLITRLKITVSWSPILRKPLLVKGRNELKLPSQQKISIAILSVLSKEPMNRRDLVRAVADNLNLTTKQRCTVRPSNRNETHIQCVVGLMASRLKDARFITYIRSELRHITDNGRKHLEGCKQKNT